jgi:hypothetical protein
LRRRSADAVHNVDAIRVVVVECELVTHLQVAQFPIGLAVEHDGAIVGHWNFFGS